MQIPHVQQAGGHGPEALNSNAEAFHKRQPRTSLRKSLTMWMLLLITAPMLASAITIYAISANHLRDSTVQDMTLMSRLMSATLSGRLSDGWTTDDRKLVDSMGRHQRLAYVCVLGPND
ncbi:MAG: hypothetical protein ACYTGQ_12090, partial [Planctomycetota bacterium]